MTSLSSPSSRTILLVWPVPECYWGTSWQWRRCPSRWFLQSPGSLSWLQRTPVRRFLDGLGDGDGDLCGVLPKYPGDEVDVVDGAVVEDPSADLQVIQWRQRGVPRSCLRTECSNILDENSTDCDLCSIVFCIHSIVIFNKLWSWPWSCGHGQGLLPSHDPERWRSSGRTWRGEEEEMDEDSRSLARLL